MASTNGYTISQHEYTEKFHYCTDKKICNANKQQTNMCGTNSEQ
jgi:hypothetical protein